MNNFNLQGLIESHNLDKKEVAEQLFPGNKYPNLALNRVLDGEATLNLDQLTRLAFFIGVPLSGLFSGGWQGKHKDSTHTFTNGEYKAELDVNTWTTRLFHKESLLHEEILHSGATPLSEYIAKLDELILKFK